MMKVEFMKKVEFSAKISVEQPFKYLSKLSSIFKYISKRNRRKFSIENDLLFLHNGKSRIQIEVSFREFSSIS